jgi:predicted transcriptional regulator
MERKRSRSDIIEDMLSSIQDKGGRIKPTHLMYRSNLSHSQLKLYLEELIEKSFINKVKNEKDNEYILITQNGNKFLEKLREMKEFEKTFGF